MKLYCANCGKQLKITRKALVKLGLIVELVSYHECSEEPIPFEIDPSVVVEASPVEGYSKFVKSLNELKPSGVVGRGPDIGNNPRRSSMTGTDDLRDRRFDQEPKILSTAPPSVLDQIKQMGNSIPSRDLKDSSTDSEMGD